MKESNKYMINVSVILTLGDRLLLIKRAATEDRHPNKLGVVGGKVDPSDGSLEDALRREVKEEIGAEITNIKLFHAHLGEKIYLTYSAKLKGSKFECKDGVDQVLLVKPQEIKDLDNFTPNTKEILSSFSRLSGD